MTPAPRSSALLLLTCVLLHATSSRALTDEARVQKLDYLRRSTDQGMIPFTTAMFETFLAAAPRSYGIFVSMAAPGCSVCPSVVREVARVAREYYTLPSRKAAKKPLFFAQINFLESDESFLAKYQIRHVPILYYFPPGRSSAAKLDENSPDNYPFRQFGIGANAIREFLNARTGARLTIVKGNYKVPFVATVRQYGAVILLIVLILAVVAVRTKAYKLPMFWLGLVMLVYIFSVGGGHYSWIHDVPFVLVNQDGVTQYIAPGSRSQYVAEGFFVSATCVSISVLVILINELPSLVPDKEFQIYAGAILFSLTMFAITALVQMFHLKMPQYLQYNEMS